MEILRKKLTIINWKEFWDWQNTDGHDKNQCWSEAYKKSTNNNNILHYAVNIYKARPGSSVRRSHDAVVIRRDDDLGVFPEICVRIACPFHFVPQSTELHATLANYHLYLLRWRTVALVF